jgi:O-antigen/teichoic acid export membrane protein
MSVLRNLALRAVSECVTKGAGTILMLASARLLGAERFGVFSLAWATGWAASIASDLGLHMIAARDAARGTDEPRALLGALLAAKSLTASAAIGVLCLVSSVLLDGAYFPVFASVGIGLVGLSIVDLGQHVLRGLGRFGHDAALQITARATMLVLGLAGLMWQGLEGLSIGILGAGVVGGAVTVVALAVDCGRPARTPQYCRRVSRLFGDAFPVGIGMLVSFFGFRIDLYLLERANGASTVGLYSSAYKLFEATLVIPSVVMTVVFPRLAARQDIGTTSRLRRHALLALSGAGFALAVAGSASASALVRLFFGVPFAAASVPLSILVWAVPPMFVNYLLTQDLIARGRSGAFAVATSVALAVNLSVNLFAIPRYGTSGAAVVTIATEATLCAACLIALRARPHPETPRRSSPPPLPR